MIDPKIYEDVLTCFVKSMPGRMGLGCWLCNSHMSVEEAYAAGSLFFAKGLGAVLSSSLIYSTCDFEWKKPFARRIVCKNIGRFLTGEDRITLEYLNSWFQHG